MVVEPLADDTPEDNINPVGRLYYSASTMICVPTPLAQETGLALGAQARQKRLAEVIRSDTGSPPTTVRRLITATSSSTLITMRLLRMQLRRRYATWRVTRCLTEPRSI